ncbi:MAG: segregation/condensation protein A [Oscillospiraceae bacterium]|nr:segregation/condensation protein A [Oscillospiraceae bacterium]MBQ9109166.1 segregation/condensation protein A [Oscillospiraceae bacterium]
MEKLTFKVAEYEGPLDLLLHLISKHQMNIYEIEISSLLTQYMEYIRAWQSHDLEVASEFLDMASRLIHLKTISLLPKYEEEEKQARAELVGQLVEYAACKRAAAELSARNLGQVLFVRQPMEMEVDLLYRLTHPATDLMHSYFDAVGRGKRRLPPQQTTFTPLVAKPVVSVNSRIIHIMRRMYKNSKLHFSRLFEENKGGRSEIVATFLAVLELLKSKRVTMDDQTQELTFHRKVERPE